MIEIYQELVNILSKGERAILATVICSQGSAPRAMGAKMLIRKDGTTLGTVGGGAVEHQVRQKAMAMAGVSEAQMVHLDLSGGEHSTAICGGQMDVLLEPVLPAETLYLFGAGHISQAAAAMAKKLSFRVVVIDPRAEFNNRERFPDADALIVTDYAKAGPQLDVSATSYIVIFSHGHIHDEVCLQFAVGTQAKYIGMVGSKKKVKEVKERLLAKGASAQRLEEVHAPIGIEIGAETPAEIAVSILAEIIRVRRGG